MALTTEFYKAKATEYLAALINRQPITPPTVIHELLTLGGACFFLARNVSPDDWKRVDWTKVPKELGEAKETIRNTETMGAFEFFGALVAQVYGGVYDAEFDPHLQLRIFLDGDEPQMEFLKGQKPKK